ncbi:helix-turn-helix domain-containing protein [Singulisphaera sp. Ch08]|uniref:Helix-turn-helix domain-containing protein n=1 Tax=Singulisphaera sp. Ch08 TaxID=3120278 RepID=A0AAU7CMM6_9BACT
MSKYPTSKYQEFAPAAPLARFVVCTWTQQTGEGEQDYHQRVLPDGCTDVIWTEETPPLVVGPATRAFVAPVPPCSTLIGVRFRPGLAPVLLGAPARLMRDRQVPLADLWGPSAIRLSDQIAERQTTRTRIRQFESTLLDRLDRAGPADNVIIRAVAWIAQKPCGRISELSRAIGISSRQLHRRFHDAVGYSPKTLQRILRFQRLLDLAHNEPSPRLDLAALAFKAGYADQAHMSRDVRELSEGTPTSVLPNSESTLAMADFFKTASTESPMIHFD